MMLQSSALDFTSLGLPPFFLRHSVEFVTHFIRYPRERIKVLTTIVHLQGWEKPVLRQIVICGKINNRNAFEEEAWISFVMRTVCYHHNSGQFCWFCSWGINKTKIKLIFKANWLAIFGMFSGRNMFYLEWKIWNMIFRKRREKKKKKERQGKRKEFYH